MSSVHVHFSLAENKSVTMITLTKRLRQESDGKPTKAKKEESRVSIRDKLLIKEVV